MQITVLENPLNSRERSHLTKVDTIVLHHSAGGSLSGAISTLRIKGYSYHYLIDKDGKVYKAVATGRVAFHAGVSTGPQGKNVNAYSIGICFIHEGRPGQDLTMHQRAAAIALLIELRRGMPALHWFTSHRLITMNPDRSGRSRKIDSRPFDYEFFITQTTAVKKDENGKNVADPLVLWEPWEGAAEMPY